jgi:hypothetical protein
VASTGASLLLLLGLTSGSPALEAHGRQASGSCHPPSHSQARLRTARLVVWKVHRFSRYTDEGEAPATTSYYACLRPGGRTHLILQTEQSLLVGEQITALTASGPIVGATRFWSVKQGGDEEVVVRDVASGRRYAVEVFQYTNPASEYPPAPALERLGTPVGLGARELTVDSRGDAAWVGLGSAGTHASESVLYVRDRSGLRRVAAEPSIDDLRFVGGSLRWRSGGAERTAPLSPE